MPTVISHALAAGALVAACAPEGARARAAGLAALCAVAPDLDVIGMRAGIPYDDLLGHRGLSHSLAAAAVLGLATALLAFRGARWRSRLPWLCVLLALATASHGAFDALTSGGLGVAFFSPVDETRYFFPLRPIVVSPISVSRLLSKSGAAVLASEIAWVWLPSLALALSITGIRRLSR